jgi:predicted TIM-barrel fold metal-dependent hydrolase
MTREEVLEPGLPIVDPHHHLWVGHDWRAELGYPADYRPKDLAADAAGHNVVRTVYVDCRMGYRADGPEPLRPVGETAFAAACAEGEAARSIGMCAGIVAWADLALGAKVGEVLDAHAEAGRGRFRGVRARVTYTDDPRIDHMMRSGPPGMLLDRWRGDGARELVARGLSLDVWIFHPQLSDVATFAQEHPDLTIVLDHMGAPLKVGRYGDDYEETLRTWRASLVEIARRPNVVLKVGGFGMKVVSPQMAARGGASSEEMARAWRPLFETCIETFGPDRCMLESNFPVDGVSGGYREIWNAFKRMTRGYSADERALLFSGVATRTYRLEPIR